MKYGCFKEHDLKEFLLPGLDGGVNLRDDPLTLNDNQLKGCNNMWFKNGALVTRPGISALTESVTELTDSSYYIYKPFTVTDTEVHRKGKACLIAYTVVGDGYSCYELRVFLTDGAGNISEYGAIPFKRASSEEFYTPENVFFAVGQPLYGDGVYAYATSASYGAYGYDIYEYIGSESSWRKLATEDFHIPVIYMNGRGTEYERAVIAGSAYEPEPVRPEELNMLTPYFEAYYSSDGISAGFQMPVSNLDDDTVYCRIYRTPEVYGEWSLSAGETTVTSTFFNTDITMQCNRETGFISFFYSDGEAFSVPHMALYGNNNIIVRACKSLPEGKARVIGSKGCIMYNARMYVYGNLERPGEIYSARLSTPLYFPKNSKAVVGEGNDAVTAMGVQNNKIIAFKLGETYIIKVTAGTDHSASKLLEDDYGDPTGTDNLEATPVHTSIGCVSDATLCICGNRLVWLGSDGGVYTLATTTYGNQNNIYEVSGFVETALKAAVQQAEENIFATEHSGYYLLFAGDKVFAMNHRIKGFGYSETFSGLREDADKVSWYCWSIPNRVRITSAKSTEGTVKLACSTPDGVLEYIALLDSVAESDILLFSEDGEVKTLAESIESYFETALLTFGSPHRKKLINSLHPSVCGSGLVKCSFGGDRTTSPIPLITSSDRLRTLRISPYLGEVRAISVKIESSSAFKAGGMSFRYAEKAE